MQVVLAKEAGLSYAAVALVTDYDAWRENETSVSAQLRIILTHQGRGRVAAEPDFLNNIDAYILYNVCISDGTGIIFRNVNYLQMVLI